MPIDPRAFAPPSQATRDTKTAIGAATLANKLTGSRVPYAGPVLGLARLVNEPSERSAVQFAGETITDPAVWNAGLGAASEAGWIAAPPAAEAAAAGGGAGAGALTMAAFNAPQIASALFEFFNGNEKDVRRAGRNREALALGDPMARALRPRSRADFEASTGGTTAGEGLAAILRNNLNGTWGTDTAHDWFPNLGLRPAQTGLARLGYPGTTEPKRGDVGGAGEIVAGTGGRLIARDDPYAWVNTPQSDEGGHDETQSRFGSGTAAEGAYGWEQGLRSMIGLPPITKDAVWGRDTTVLPRRDMAPMPWTPQPTDMVVRDEGGQMGPTRPETPTGWLDYMASLEGFDPELAERMARAARERDENYAAGNANIP